MIYNLRTPPNIHNLMLAMKDRSLSLSIELAGSLRRNGVRKAWIGTLLLTIQDPAVLDIV
jgi:hypothetical protein